MTFQYKFYCTKIFTAINYTPESRGAIQSMSGTESCYDNSRMDSFFATLKDLQKL